MIYLSHIENKLQVMLAEYNTLRSEIQYHNERQNSLLQFHITVLTAILGLVVTKTASFWTTLLIPIESSIFGLWFCNYFVTIVGIGSYIRDSIEKEMRHDFGKQVMNWESSYRKNEILETMNQKIDYIRLIHLTFGLPSFLCIITTLGILLISTLNLFGVSINFLQEITNIFNLNILVNETKTRIIPIFLAFAADLCFFLVYCYYMMIIKKLTNKETEMCKIRNNGKET